MERSHIENTVRDLWVKLVEERSQVKAADLGDKLKELIEQGLVEVKNGYVVLTKAGEELGRKLIRLHRLTERLLFDILEAEEKVYEKVACEVEHVIPEALEEAICTLLGHPSRCPHGKPIPPGRCCLEGRRTVYPLVRPLSELRPGVEARVSYMEVDEDTYNQLVSLGIAPGKKVVVQAVKPVVVVSAGATQVSLDRSTAEKVKVVVIEPTGEEGERGQHRWRHRWRHRLRLRLRVSRHS
jgi:DtxR family Mn-dependent transcriptional regulator